MDEADSDEVPVIELEVIPEGEGGAKEAPRKSVSWSFAIGVRVFCLILWIFMAWAMLLFSLAFMVGLLISLFSPKVAGRRPAMLQAFTGYVTGAMVVVLGSFIGIFSPRIACNFVAMAWKLLGKSGENHPFQKAWQSGMSRFRTR